MMSNLEFQTKTYMSHLAFKCLSICEEILADSSDKVKGNEQQMKVRFRALNFSNINERQKCKVYLIPRHREGE